MKNKNDTLDPTNALILLQEEEMEDPELDYKLKRSCRKMIKVCACVGEFQQQACILLYLITICIMLSLQVHFVVSFYSSASGGVHECQPTLRVVSLVWGLGRVGTDL